jgi:hypothetical protein
MTLLWSLFLLGIPAQAEDKKEPADARAFRAFNQAEMVFIGKVTKVIDGPVSYTDPPGFSQTLTFDVAELLRGKKPKMPDFGYSVTQNEVPRFPKEKTWIVAADSYGDNNWNIRFLAPADDKLLALATKAARLPIGWKLEKGEVVSPWAGNKQSEMSKQQWAKQDPEVPTCAKTGRPALSAGDDVEFTSEQILPPGRHEFRNPYGDGQFRVTVTNRTDRVVSVPALRTDGQTIFWEDSLVILNAGAPYVLPRAGKLTETKPMKLKPKESVSTVVDVLPLEGPQWARGGWRMYFQFCLGEKSSMNFFYYNSSHHDRLREAGVKKP